MYSSYSRRDRQFEDYLRDGISAAKSGNHSLAQTLLNRAIMVNSADARPYLWLSATTDDPAEQQEYLERAVAADPYNSAARRGLAMLTGKIDPSRLLEDSAGHDEHRSKGDIEAEGHSFECPQCGGHLTFALSMKQLTCEYCGYILEEIISQDQEANSSKSGQALDFFIPTTRGHHWAQAQHRLSCAKCGAVSILPSGHKVIRCAYCGSNQLVESSEHEELIDPHLIALMNLDEKEAIQKAREWLGKGIFAPDNLLHASRGLRLRPAYYSCWVFDGTLEVSWSCEVAEGSGDNRRWVPRNGVHNQFFSEVLVSGVKSLSARDLASVEPFNLMEVEEFKPEYLAGWPTILYDRSLADASLVARQKVMKQLRSHIQDYIEIGNDKRRIRTSGGKWGGMTFKHILLPLWVGAYRFQNKKFHVLVNGQNGEVGGDKPRDAVKYVFATLTAAMFIFLLVVLYWVFSGGELP